MEDSIYLIYNKLTGEFEGFFIDVSIDNYHIKDESDYVRISPNIHSYLLGKLPNIKVNIEKIKKDIDLVESEDFFMEFEPKVDIDMVKKHLRSKIKNFCEQKITAGLMIELSNGEIKEFTFKLEDQINLKEIVDNYTSGDTIFYHAKDETIDILYSYDDIILIHKALYNNKIYNLIYTTILSNYIQNEYNEKMYEGKIVINYGFATPEITKKVDELYEQQKIS